MSRLLKSQGYLMKCLLFVLLFGFISLGAIGGCNNDNAKAQGDADVEVDFLVDVISGEVLENPDGDGFILKLEVSPNTVFIEESPGINSGTINTEDFLKDFLEIFGDVHPNSILTFRDDDEIAVAVPVKLNSVVFDTAQAVAEFLVTPLDQSTDSSPPDTAVILKRLTDVQSPFGQASLYIDSTPFCRGVCAEPGGSFPLSIACLVCLGTGDATGAGPGDQ